jgi:hypothetical protein
LTCPFSALGPVGIVHTCRQMSVPANLYTGSGKGWVTRPDVNAVLCAPGRVTDLARLSLVPEFGRGHGALYNALNAGHAGVGRLRRALAGWRCRPGRTGGSGWRWT